MIKHISLIAIATNAENINKYDKTIFFAVSYRKEDQVRKKETFLMFVKRKKWRKNKNSDDCNMLAETFQRYIYLTAEEDDWLRYADCKINVSLKINQLCGLSLYKRGCYTKNILNCFN